MRRNLAIMFIGIGICLLLFVLYKNSKFSQYRRIFSANSLIESSWEKYKTEFINTDGRVIDIQQNDATTSEAQSYALLRAVWGDDRATFDHVWQWTKNNLTSKDSHLFGWRWGRLENGSYGFSPNGGENSASDADSDMAYALLLAARRWGDESYITQAKPIIADIWNIETAEAGGSRYLIAGNWAKRQNDLIINPSYFAPYEWRLFAMYDKNHDWNGLIAPAYTLLTESGKVTFDNQSGVGLPPDWLSVDIQDGSIHKATNPNISYDYSFDAIRVPWRIAADYELYKSNDSKDYLSQSFDVLAEYYTKNGMLPSSFHHHGTVKATDENPSMYATSLGYFMIVHPNEAKKIYQDKIIKLYSNDTSSFNSNIPYYEQNWLWFGAAIYNHYISYF